MKEVLVNRVYKHYKGDYYLVVDIAYNSETLEKMVIYRSLYGQGELWVRPYDLFLKEVDGQCRFKLQEIESRRK